MTTKQSTSLFIPLHTWQNGYNIYNQALTTCTYIRHNTGDTTQQGDLF